MLLACTRRRAFCSSIIFVLSPPSTDFPSSLLLVFGARQRKSAIWSFAGGHVVGRFPLPGLWIAPISPERRDRVVTPDRDLPSGEESLRGPSDDQLQISTPLRAVADIAFTTQTSKVKRRHKA